MNQTLSDPIIKKRKFGLDKIPEGVDMRGIEETFGGINGIMTAEIDPKSSLLRLEYDLRQVRFEDIEKAIEKSGLKLSQKRFQRWKRRMAKFTEQNELDNLNAPVSSCCELPDTKAEACSHCAASGKDDYTEDRLPKSRG